MTVRDFTRLCVNLNVCHKSHPNRIASNLSMTHTLTTDHLTTGLTFTHIGNRAANEDKRITDLKLMTTSGGLGGVSTTSELVGQSVQSIAPISGITLLGSFYNPVGAGILSIDASVATPVIKWKADADGLGAAELIDFDGVYEIRDSSNPIGGILRIDVRSAELVSGDYVLEVYDPPNKLFPDIPKAESDTGVSYYYCVYLTNSSDFFGFNNIELFAHDQAAVGQIYMGLDPAGLDGTATTIADNKTAPVGVTFVNHLISSRLSINNIPVGSEYPVWLELRVDANNHINLIDAFASIVVGEDQ